MFPRWRPSRAGALVLLCALGAWGQAAPLPDKMSPSHYLSIYIGRSKLILGTDEIREGAGFAYGYGRHDPRLKFKGIPAQLVHALHFMRGYGQIDRDIANSFGYEAVARYRFHTNGSTGAYMDLGWGLEYTDKLSPDIDSHWNSSPLVGAGIAINQPQGELMLGIAWYHVSNGGTHKPNLGQNYVLLNIGWRY